MAEQQPLVAAHVFGTVANAAFGAAFLYLKANGPPIFQDSLRLVLVIFLISTALWSIIDFSALLISAPSGCQVAVAFGAAFDQLARSSFQQFLLWGTNGGVRLSWTTFVPQLAIICRFVLGGVYVGFQRSDFHPVCISSTSILPLSVSLLGVDALIIIFLLAKLVIVGDNNKHDSEGTKKSKILLIAVAGAGLWTAMSAPMILGAKSLPLAARKVLPAIGVLVVIMIILITKDRIFGDVDENPKITMSSPPTRHYRLSDMVRNAGTRRSTRMSQFQQPSNHYSDAKQGETTTSTTALHALNRNKELPAISGPEPGQSERGIGGMPVQGQLFPPIRPQPPPTVLDMRAFATPSIEHSKKPKKKKTKQIGKEAISGPILRDDSSNPLERIATVDLDTAARAEEERRAAHPRPLESHSIGGSGHSVLSSEELLERSRTVGERKLVGQIPIIKTNLEPIIESGGASKTSSAQLSPGVENMRQRSPRQSQQSFSRQTPPPLPPLKTPGTMNTLAVPSPKHQTPAQQDAWDLLAVPKRANEAPTDESPMTPDIPLRSPLRDHRPTIEQSLAERPSTSPAAKSIATMTQTSQPDNHGAHRRSQSVRSRRSRPRDQMFTDARTPPPIPEKCMNRKSFLPSNTLYVDAPPPYKFNGQAFKSPNQVVANLATIETIQSPSSKPENKLSLFPPNYSKSGMDSPKQKAEAAVRAALAIKPTAVPAALPTLAELPGCAVPPRQRNRAHTTGIITSNMSANDASKPRSPIRTTTLITPIDKPLPASPSIPALVRESVLNRPRPITRTPETGRFLTSYTHRPNTHRRSASCGSISTKKSIVHNEALGSPSALPPLPPVPTERSPVIQGSAGDTRSMSVEEKMTLLNPRSSELRRKRRSMSLPEMPELSHVAMPVASFLEEKGFTHTARSTMSSVRTQSILNMADPEKPGMSRSTTLSYVEPVPAVPVELLSKEELHPTRKDVKVEETRQAPPYPDSPLSPIIFKDDAPMSGPSQKQFGGSVIVAEEIPRSMTPSSRDSWELDTSDFDSVQGEDAFTVLQPTTYSLAAAVVAPKATHHSPSCSVDNTYHDRLGSHLPSFSSRQHPINKSRRGPPPHPLLLNGPPKALFIETEPSPLESPNQALDVLEQQLQKLERNSRGSSVAQEQRMTLLADLEKEMGLQETNWQNLRHTIVRDSLSTVNASPQQNAQLPSLWAKVLEQRGSRLLADPTASQAGSRMSLLTVSHPTSAQLGSPTPPDTDEDEIPVMLDEIVNLPRYSPPSLWHAEVPSPKILKQDASLWSPSASVSFVIPNTITSPTLASTSSNKNTEDLVIQSSQLWTPNNKFKKTPSAGLWHLPVPSISFDTQEEPESPEATKSKPRPITIRPPRKSRRMTALPDILESPEPLSTRHNTLGIFQFPWGEKSHTGTIPLPVYGAMPGTMTSGRVPGHVAPDPVFTRTAEDEGSFFDDCDEEDMGDNFSDFDDDDDNDDDFDETTLWEIASLLKSDKLTTRTRVVSGEWLNNSNRRTSVVASPTESCDSPQCATIPMVLDVEPVVETKKEKKTLWEGKSRNYTIEKGVGLKQPNRRSWQEYVGAMDEKRVRKGSRDGIANVALGSLWEAELPTERASSGTLLWSPVTQSHPVAPQKPHAQPETSLWEMPAPLAAADAQGLWPVSSVQPLSLTSPKPLTGLAMRPSGRKASQDHPPKSISTSLWFADKQAVSSPHWITISKVEMTEEPELLERSHVTAKSDTLWSRPEPTPAPLSTTGTWQPSTTHSSFPSPGSPELQPRYDRKLSVSALTEDVPDLGKQTLWKRPVSSVRKSGGADWLSKSRKHRTFQEDVDTVQDYLSKRWGGM